MSKKPSYEELEKQLKNFHSLLNNISGLVYRAKPDWTTEIITQSEPISGYSTSEFNNRKVNWVDIIHPDDKVRVLREFARIPDEIKFLSQEYRIITKDKEIRWVLDKKTALFCNGDQFCGIDGLVVDITQLKQLEQKLFDNEAALEKRLQSLTQPLNGDVPITFEQLFNLPDIQRLQDEFALATGVASIITQPDGTPITEASNFCRLCKDIIRKTEKGLCNCFKSDAVLGRYNPEGPIIQPCLSGGLWDAGAAITIDDRHVANWLIGQVRDSSQTESKMRSYAREINADEDDVADAFKEVPAMSYDQFEKVANVLFTLANQLSNIAHQNLQQARFIAEYEQAEEALKTRETFLNRIIDQSPFATWISDANGTLQRANPALKRFLNLTDEQLVGQYNVFKDPQLERQGVLSQIRTAYEQGKTVHFNCYWDGNDIPTLNLTSSNSVTIEATAFPILNTAGEITHVVFNWIDITARKEAEEALQKSEARLSAIFQAAETVSLIITDVHEPVPQILNFSPGAENIFGYTQDEMFGKPISILHPPDYLETIRQGFQKMREKRTGFSNEIIMVRKSGEQFPALHSVYPLLDDQENIYAILGVSFDISEREKLESQLRQAQKMESVGRLAGGVAHDFNNMLSVILGNTELVLDDLKANDPLIECMNEIQKAATRSADLTRQLLAFARKQTIAPKVIDLNHTIEGMLKMLGRLIGEDIELAWRPIAGLWPVKIDPSQIDQILANLCVNARDSIKGIGKVTIETKNIHFDKEYCNVHNGFIPGDFVMLAVSDNGCGMEKEILDNIFEPFFTTKDFGLGTGLGLATVYGIVKQNNGFINVYSELEKGTTLKIYLPRYSEKITQVHIEGLNEKTVSGTETILLVEDEKAILKMTVLMLKRLGYNVLSASSPAEAIKICQSYNGDIDLLITDVVMPEMSGRNLAENLSQLYPNLKCLYMSGYTANVIAHHGVLDEDIQFINKPFSTEDIGQKIREVLNGINVSR